LRSCLGLIGKETSDGNTQFSFSPSAPLDQQAKPLRKEAKPARGLSATSSDRQLPIVVKGRSLRFWQAGRGKFRIDGRGRLYLTRLATSVHKRGDKVVATLLAA
jgi:hypothetical protein